MAKQEIYNTEVTESGRGISLDTDPSLQPSGTTRFTLNGVEDTSDGQQRRKSNEPSNFACTSIPSGFYPMGDRYIEDDTSVVILNNPATSKDEIGLLQKDNKYRTQVNTGVLGLNIANQCDIIYRLRRGNERVIYWVDGDHKARTFNLDRPYNFFSQAYQTFIRSGGNPLLFVGEKWDAASFELVKSYAIMPTFGTMSIIETGNTLPGSYSFTIQLVDDDLNPTSWITTSNSVNIYNDTTNQSYDRIRGSRNIQIPTQAWPRTSKSIKVQIDNLDKNFPFYRIAIIRAAGNTGKPEKVLVSDLYSTENSNFIYTGNDGELIETSLQSIIVDNEVIFAPKHIEQQDNRLILAHMKGKGVNWCDFQKYASKIETDVVYQEVILNNINSEPNVKNGNSTWRAKGYMPGEVVSSGIVYLFDDMTLSPVFHIPGKSNDDAETSALKVYELSSNYLDIHNCSTDNYWGLDHLGNALVGNPVRHIRLPFRHEVAKPLVTQTGTVPTDIDKHRLKLTITLNPAWTPGPIEYPDDGAIPTPNPLLINYTFNYQVTGAGGTSSFSGTLTKNMVVTPIEFVIYDDTVDLSFISGTDYTTIDLTSDLGAYQVPGNERFLIAQVKEDYVLSSSTFNDVAEIFGLEFSNIERPRADVIGFFIVRNERLDDDKLIIDNAIFGPNTTFEQYVSFGLITPRQYYTTDNCGRTGNPSKTVNYYDKGVWFFNPEFQYYGKKTEFDEIVIGGGYVEISVDMPTISNTENSSCNNNEAIHGGSKGVYINDVQAGTSYDPDLNKAKNKDDDGFDLIVGYRNTNMQFLLDDGSFPTFPTKKRIAYLNAASYLNFDGDTFYNVSVDNKIGMYLTDDTLDTAIQQVLHNTVGNTNGIIYGSLVRNSTTAYSNFMTRPYYKEHNNPVLFGDEDIIDDFEVFNGDAEISAMNFVSSTFNDMVLADRTKKNVLWKIILGVQLIVAAIVVEVVTLGAGTPLAALILSNGVSLLAAGLKFNQYKAMIDVDYELGLKDTVTDGGVFETIREGLDTNDDTIRWFADRISNIYIESSVSFGLRSGLTSGITDFVDAPAPYDELGFRGYLTEKLTVIDREQGSGRLYKGYAQAEFYDMNLDFMRLNKEKNFIHLPVEYDCCGDVQETFPLRRRWSEQSFQEEKVDNYRIFLPNNYNDMEGEHGEITDLYRLGNNMFIHTKESLWQQPTNLQEKINSELITFIGTGEFLAIPPRKVLDDNLGSPGTKHKWATIKTPSGVVFVDEIEHKICLHGQRIDYISSMGIDSWSQNNIKANISKQIFDRLGIEFAHDNNPANSRGVGYLSTYDKRYKRVVITKKDYALLPDKLALLNIYNNNDDEFQENTFYYYNGGSGSGGILAEEAPIGIFFINEDIIPFSNTDYFENKSWTISFTFGEKIGSWTSWHSYLPNYYIQSQNSMYSFLGGLNSIWKHNQEGNFHRFFGVDYGFIIEVVLGANSLVDKTTEDITIQTLARTWSVVDKQFVDERYKTFNRLIAYNSRQCTGLKNIVVKETKANPQDWYRQQIVNLPGEIIASRKGRDWNINHLRDQVIDTSLPMFTSAWSVLKNDYYIDKMINSAFQIVDADKVWNDLESLRDKYIVIRLIFDNFNNINLTLDYTLSTEQTSVK